ncbi:MAG: hypothetical protein J1E01_07030 [Acetatifactor sp.]|nr:hypothetical protein [Acetatifactor sp.]
MVIVLALSMLIVPWMAGSGILRILYGNSVKEEFSFCDALLTGGIAVIGVAEMVHLSAVFGHLSLSRCALLFGGLTGILSVVSLAIWLIPYFLKKGSAEGRTLKKPPLLFLLPALLFLGQAVYILLLSGIYLNGDMTMETVVSFLYSNEIYHVNPMTGAAYQGGIPLRLEILCLPTFYSILCSIFSLEPQTVVWQVIPCVTLVCCYGAFCCVGKTLFPESGKRQACFLSAVAVLLWVGSYAFGMDGFGVLYGGFRGVVIRNTVLIPYLVSLCLRKKWKLAALCIVAEACLVWTFYGAGGCVLLVAGLAVSRLVWRKAEKQTEGGRRNG